MMTRTPNAIDFVETKADYVRRAASAVSESYRAYLNSFQWMTFTVVEVPTAEGLERVIVMDKPLSSGQTVLVDLGTLLFPAVVKIGEVGTTLSPMPPTGGQLRKMPEFRNSAGQWTVDSTVAWVSVLCAQEKNLLEAFSPARASHVGRPGLAAAGLQPDAVAPDATVTFPLLVPLEPWMVAYGFLAAADEFWIV